MKYSVADDDEFELVTTRGGDHGESGYYSGERRRKDDLLFEALGDIDELNSVVGVARARLHARRSEVFGLTEIQRQLLRLSSMVATTPGHELYDTFEHIVEEDVEALERVQRNLMKQTRIEPVFILPGESEESATIDVARSVCRRAERRLVAVIRERGRFDLHACQNFLNRLSDYLFVLGRHIDQKK
jgi:cob(I)alamin adenosyltransferase